MTTGGNPATEASAATLDSVLAQLVAMQQQQLEAEQRMEQRVLALERQRDIAPAPAISAATVETPGPSLLRRLQTSVAAPRRLVQFFEERDGAPAGGAAAAPARGHHGGGAPGAESVSVNGY